MTDHAFGWWVIASLGLHAGGMLAVSLSHTSMDLTIRPAVAIEVVRQPAPEPTPPPPPPPRVKAAAPRDMAPAPRPVEPAPQITTPNLLDAPAPPQATPPRVDSTLLPSTLPSTSGPVMGAPAGAGRLFAEGYLLVAPGPSSSGGSAPGARGQGLAATGDASSQVAASGTGLTALARPLGGGYQVKPQYPDRAIRDRAQGVTLLSVEVLSSGHVGQIVVKRSAGHRDLDHAAVAAVKQWLFEPARRGPTPVTVWATLPVRFELTDR